MKCKSVYLCLFDTQLLILLMNFDDQKKLMKIIAIIIIENHLIKTYSTSHIPIFYIIDHISDSRKDIMIMRIIKNNYYNEFTNK